MYRSTDTAKEPSLTAQQGYWDARWEQQRSPNPWQARRADTILAMLQTLPLTNPRILDLGCATGWMTDRLSTLGPSQGVDLSEAAIAIAKAQFPTLRFAAGDLYQISLADAPVDIVVCQEVIAHVSDQPKLVERIAEVLKPGGYLIMTAANALVMDRVRFSDGLLGVGPEDPDEHIKKWLSMKGLKALLRPHFEILATTSVIPLGHRGVLRLVNSTKLNRALALLMSPARLEALKERMGFGYSIIALGKKRA